MRLMLIDDDPRYRTLLRHHISCDWPDVDLVSYNPRVRGPLTPGFLAQGYSVVLLDHEWKGGSGLDWLKDFHGREGFAPVIFLSAEDESADAVEARAAGAFEVIGKTKIKHTKLNDAIRRAADEQAKAQSRWRMSAGAKMAQDFAGARLKEYRRIELIAKGSVSDLFLAESATHGDVVVLKVTPAIRKETGVDQSMERFLQEFEILREIRHPNIVRIYDLGVTDDHLFLAMEHFARGDLRKRMSEGLTARQSLDLRARHRVRAAGDPRGRHFSSRSQARQRDAARRRQHRAHRLRPRQTRGAQDGSHRQGPHLRHAALHEPGAGARQGNRRAQRHLQRSA